MLAIGSLTILGAALGLLLGVASHYLRVEMEPLEADLLNLLPGSQCGQCGYVGCGQAAAALAKGEAEVTLCIPGGNTVAKRLAERLGVTVDLSKIKGIDPVVAAIDEKMCIGCLRCFNDCSTDAIVGGPRQIHVVITEQCHGCAKCLNTCPTEAVSMRKIPPSIETWHWPKPEWPQR